MRGALAIAAAEIRQHRLVIWAALLLGVLPLLVHFLAFGAFPKARRGPEALATDALLVFSVVLSFATALGLGAGAVSRDLGERRLGFYLARPLPLFQYWLAKLSVAFLLAVVAGALVLLPGYLFGALETGKSLARLLGWVWLGGLAFVVAASGAAGGAFRSRSGLVILDIVMAPLTWAATVLAMKSVFESGTDQVVVPLGVPWLGMLAILVLLAAGAAQVCLGRLELRRGHILLSAIAWGGLLVLCVGGLLLFNGVVASSTPGDLRLPHGVLLHAPRSGAHVMLEGLSTRWSRPSNNLMPWRGTGAYVPRFVLDARGQFVRLGGQTVSGLAWSDDGRRLAWSKEGPFPGSGSRFPGHEPTTWVLDLDRPGRSPLRVARTNVDEAAVHALSPSGQRLLLSTRTGKEVADAASGVIVRSVEERLYWTRPSFLSEVTIRALRMDGLPAAAVFPSGAGTLPMRERATVVDWDLASGRVTERGTIALKRGQGGFTSLVPTDDWQRVLRFDGAGLFLHDLDGRVVATLVDGWPTRMNKTAGPLSGGRHGCIEEGPEGLRLRVFDAEGRPVSDALLKGRFPLRIGGESPAGLLAIGMAPFSDEGKRETLFVDLATGRVTRRETGLSPALRRWELGREFEAANPEPGSLATKLFLSDEGQLLLLEPATGNRTVMVSRRAGLED